MHIYSSEDHQGIPFMLQLGVIDVITRESVAQVAVDIWHCDAVGVYSHYIRTSNNVVNSVNDHGTFLARQISI
jgi:protocatechuate 3,4-dioxygenase beta subunit